MDENNKKTGTQVDEIAKGIFRISTSVSDIPGGFSFNQYLIVDDKPMLFHTGPRKMHKLVKDAIASIIDPSELRYIGFSHFESDECGSLNEFLGLSPDAEPVCSRVNGMVNGDFFDKQPKVLADGEELLLGSHRVRWFDTPHLPHGWECGYLMEEETGTLLCGDLFTQGGADLPPLTSGDILESSEGFRSQLDYFSHTKNLRPMMAKLIDAKPTTLACMHGSAWEGDGSRLLKKLADSLDS